MHAVQSLPTETGSLPAPENLRWASRVSPQLGYLVTELERVEQRLGTPRELPGDLELAQNLGHKIRNEACILLLRRDHQAIFSAA